MKSSLEDRDTDIRRAGLFPTFDQIELLSLLLQYGVNELQLEAFWNIRFAELWDIECTSSSGFSGHNRSTASSIEEGSESDVDRGGVPVLTMQNINSYGLNHGEDFKLLLNISTYNQIFVYCFYFVFSFLMLFVYTSL